MLTGTTISLPLPITITGTVDVNNQGVLQVSVIDGAQPAVIVTSNECAKLEGNLQLVVNSSFSLSTIFVLTQNGSCPVAEFNTVSVIDSNGKKKFCSVRQDYTDGKLSVLVKRSCSNSVKWIAIGVVGGVILLALVVLAIYYFAYQKRCTRGLDCLWKSQDKQPKRRSFVTSS